MRAGEREGQDYYFVSVADFQDLLENKAFLEHAQVFDNFYGTAQHTVEANLHNSLDVILEIDWQGAQQIKALLPDSVSIFILPPSIAVLQQRLRGRGQDDEQTIERRMRDAVAEMRHYHEFDYVVVNDVFEQALTELKTIMLANRLTQKRQQLALKSLLSSLLS
jgi:guanylate kinase